MNTVESRLQFACKQVSGAASEMLDWIDDNPSIVATERLSMLHEFYGIDVRAAGLGAAVNQPPCVAFVGPSRSGKTQVFTSLIERGRGPLNMRFDGIREQVDYQRLIVPDGSKQGASMVIRLSEQKKTPPQNFPIRVRLLSLADVIKVLGNAFFTACKDRQPAPSLADVRSMHARVTAKTADSPVAGLTEGDIWEVRSYFAKRFGDEPIFRALSAAGFWQSLATLAPYLSNAARGELLGLMWGGLEPFRLAFTSLAEILASLGGSLEANCALDSILSLDPRTGKLLRREDSIINAQTIDGFVGSDDQSVLVCGEFGNWVSISRSGLAALAAEVRLPVPGWSSEVLEKADLLEFPGIDPRESIPNLDRTLNRKPALLAQLYARAKSVYLLDRYTEELAITCMVVCIDPASVQVGELAGLVSEWIERSHGPDAIAREQQDTGLFLAFTKLDKDFADVSRGVKERKIDWDRRIGDILIEGFGRGHSWPLEWTPSRSFDSIHLLRNPGFKAKQVCDYSREGREIGFKPGQPERIARANREFLKSEIVRRHVSDPMNIWNEALALNDGGITYLGQSIAGVCDKRVKVRQIVTALNSLRQLMKDRLQRYYLADNFELQRDKRHTSGLLVVRRLKFCAERRRLGHLIRAFQLSEAEFADVLQNIEVRSHLPTASEKASAQAAGMNGAGANGSVTELRKSDTAAEALLFARTSIDHWIDAVRSTAQAAGACQRFEMPRQALLSLVDELIVGATRMEFEHRVAAHIESAILNEADKDARLAKAAICVAEAVGGYVMRLGFDDIFSNSHPRRKGHAQKPIFPPRNAISLADLDDQPSPETEFYSDWSQAFITMVDDNAAGLRERDIEDEQNQRLGQLLRLLETPI